MTKAEPSGEPPQSTVDIPPMSTTSAGDSRGRRTALVGYALVMAGLPVLGGLGGWWFHSRYGELAPIVVTRPVTVISQGDAGVDAVPNVIGLDSDRARQAFMDAGIDPSVITLVNVPYAGQTRVVVKQDPGPGAPLAATAKLSIATAAKVPRLIGQPGAAARKTLSALGARVVVQSQYVPGKPEGSVVSVSPPFGATLPPSITLTLAEPLSGMFVTRLRPIISDCSTGSVTINATAHDEAITCSVDPSSPLVTEYALNRRIAAFNAVVGTDDSSLSAIPAEFLVFVDGKLAFRRTVAFGKTESVHVPLAGALRLRLEVRAASRQSTAQTPTVAWASPRLEGGASVIDALSSSQP